MDNVTFEQLVAKVESLQSEVDELLSGLNYAVYGIGTAHPDPREEQPQPKG